MISRLTAIAATFAVCATATLAYATATPRTPVAAPSAAVKQVRVVQFERVVIVAKRNAQAAI